jgi:hypothetical protein
VIKLYTVG